MRIKLTKKDIFWSYAGTVLSMVANFLMLPFIIYYLDADMLGLWYIFTSVGAIATLFDCGFGVTFARNITYCWSGAAALKKENVEFTSNTEPDYRLMKNVIDTCKTIYLIISGSALVFLWVGGTSYIRYVSRDVSGYTHYYAWIIYSFAIFLNLYYGYYTSFLIGVGAVGEANKNTVFSRLAQISCTLIMLFCGFGIIGVCSAYLVYGTLLRVLGKRKFYRYKGIGESLGKIKEKTPKGEKVRLFKTVWHNAWRDGVISITEYLSNQITTVICSLFLTLTDTGVYSLGVQLATAIGLISGTLYITYQPSLQASYVNQDQEKLKRTMSVIVTSFCYLFVLGTVGALVVGLPLLRIIKPEQIVSGGMFLALCTYQFMLRFRNCYTSYFSCTNRIPYLKSFVVSALMCVSLSFIFMGPLKLGVPGLIAAQIISQLVFNVWYWPIKANKEMGLTFGQTIARGTQELMGTIRGFLARSR